MAAWTRTAAWLPCAAVALFAPAWADADTAVMERTPALSITAPLISTTPAVNVGETDGSVVLTVKLDPASSGTVTVDYFTIAGNAQEDQDYAETSGTLTFEAGDTSRTITVPIIDDAGYDRLRLLFFVGLRNASGATLPSPHYARVVIESDEPKPTATIDDVAVNEAAGRMTLTLRLNHTSSDTIEYLTNGSLVSGTATAAADYGDFLQGSDAVITMPARALSATFDIAIVDDTEEEGDETIGIVWRKHPDHHAKPDSLAFTGTIRDNDTDDNNASPTFNEGGAATRSFAETVGGAAVTSASNIGDAVTATDTDAGDTLAYSLEGADASKFTIVSTSGQLRTRVDETYDRETKARYAVTVKVMDGNGGSDTIAVTLLVTNAVEAPLAPTVTATSGGTTSLDVSWRAPENAGRPAIANYDIQYRAGTSGPWTDGPQDRTGTGARISGLTASTAYQVRVRATNGDGDGAWSENASASTGARGNSAATGAPGISGTVRVGQTLTATTTDIADANGLTDPPGWAYQWIRSDGMDEQEIPGATAATYVLTEDDLGSTIRVRVTFTDGAGYEESVTSEVSVPVPPIPVPPVPVPVRELPVLGIADSSATEGSPVQFTVTLSDPAPTGGITLQFSTSVESDDTATTSPAAPGGADFTSATDTTVTIPATQTTVTFSVPTADDTTDEPDETFTVTIDNPSEGAVLGDSTSAKGTIVDNDTTAVTLTADPASVDEDEGATAVTVTATLEAAAMTVETVVTVSVGGAGDTLNGITRPEPTTLTLSVGASTDTAIKGTDYTAVDDLALTIDAGQTSGTATFTLTPTNDGIVEGNETLSVSGTTGVEDLTVTGASVTIGDDDERRVAISPTSLTLAEGDSTTYTVVLGSKPTGTVRVTISGTTGTDLRRSRSFLSFRTSNWNEPQTVTVTARQDEDAEDDTVTIVHAVSGADYEANGVTADAVSVTIDDDDRVSTGVDLSVSHTSFDEDASFTGVVVTGTLNGIARAEPTTLTLSVGASEDAATEGTDYVAVDDLGLTIPAGRASGTAIFVFKPTDDRIDEPAEAVSITGATEVAGLEVIGTTLVITDNDERGVTVSPAALTLSEGESATYTVVLDTEPTETVTVTPTVSGSPDVAFEPSSLTFTSTDWDTAQTMTISATEDDDAYHDSSIVSHVAKGAEYASLVDGEFSLTISDNEVASQDMLPVQVTDVSVTATATHVDLTWSAVDDAVLGYRVEASYDGGANWAEVEDNPESADTTYQHDVGLNFSETRRYRVSAVGENGAGLPSVSLQASATATTGGLTATVPMPQDTTIQVPAIDVCWIPEGVDASELSDVALATTPVYSSRSGDLSDLPWQSIGSGSSEVDCEDGIGFRQTSISANQRYAFRMRANHDGVWLVSNDAQAVLADSSKPLRTVVTAGASGLSGDTPVPNLICRDYDDPATREDEAGSFFLSIGFTTASPEYLRYEPVNGFDPSGDLTLVNATAQLLEWPYDTRLGYRVRITPSVWGEPVAVSVAGDVVTHGETSVGNRASGEFRLETSDAVDCDTVAVEPARRSQVTSAGIEADGDRNGEWSAGEPIRVTLQFAERVRVTMTDGVPSVTLTLGEADTTAQPSDGEAETGESAQSSDGEAATTEVTALFSHVAHEDTLVFEHLVTADRSPIRDIALLADSLSLNGGQIDSFSGPAVELAHAGVAVVGGPIVQPDLTAGWSMIPGAHEGGESPFEIHFDFSEDVDPIEVIGEQDLIDHAFTVTNGSIEAIRPARDSRGEFLPDEWAMRVVPASEEPVTISPVVDLACDEPGAICTIDDRPLSEAPSVTVHRIEQALSVADAEVGEGPGAVLVFEVTLARAADHPVTVDYATADGTATAGEDYEAVSGTLSFETGQTTATVQVPVLDDSHDEGEETLTLVLTNASNARIHDGEALGVIVNSDPIPSAWLSRFGRAASDHVAQAVARRLERGPSEEHLNVGGLRLDRLYTSFADPDGGRAASGSTHMDLDSQGSPGGMTAPYGGTSRASDALPSLRDALMGSSFFYTHGESEDASAAPLTAWGETASTRFKGSEGSLSLDGEVTTAMLGLDKRYGRWLVGSTLSYSEGEGGYQSSGALGGSMDSTLTSLNPYAHYELNETTSLWGVFGYGSGSLRVTPEGAESAIETDLSNRMAAFGGRGLLSVRSGDAGRFELALRSDALLTRTDSEAVQGLVAAQGATSRVRLMLEGSGSMPVATGGVLKPSLEAGLRYDAGDAETGAGLEVGGGLGYAAGHLSVDINARALVAHEDTDYEEWGFSGSLAYTPGKDGRGLSMKLGSAWGATQSRVQSLWSRQNASGLAGTSPFEAAQRFQAELGYGIAGRRKDALWVPFIAAQAADGDSQSLRMGVKLTSGPNVEMGLEFGRLENGRGSPEHAVQIGGALRW